MEMKLTDSLPCTNRNKFKVTQGILMASLLGRERGLSLTQWPRILTPHITSAVPMRHDHPYLEFRPVN